MKGTSIVAYKTRFTKSEIEKMKCPQNKRQVRFRDESTAGLFVRVTPTGNKTFVYYRKFAGWTKPHEATLGIFPEMTIEQARAKAAELSGRFAAGETPGDAARKKREAVTFDDIFVEYINEYAKQRTKTWTESLDSYRRYFERWKTKKVIKIKRSDVQAWVNDLGADKGHHTANRNYDIMRAVFSWARKKDKIDIENPCIGVDRFETQARERFIQPGDEFERFADAVDSEPNDLLRDFFWLLLFTGARKSNVMTMRWEQVNLDTETWRIPITKNGDSHTVPLTSAALEVLKKRQLKRSSEWVFPSDGITGHLVSPKTAWARLLKRAAIADLRIHDLRRTAGSYMAIQGVSSTIIGKALGHRSPQATAIYARLSQDPVRMAMQQAQAALTDPKKLLAHKKAVVVSMKLKKTK